MKTCAQIESGLVVNVSVWSADPPAGLVDITGLEVGIGHLYDRASGVFAAPPEPEPEPAPVPTVVSMRQARLALLSAGLLDEVDAAISALPGVDGAAARIEWEFAAEVKRSSPIVVSLSAALGLTEARLDALFFQAAAL